MRGDEEGQAEGGHSGVPSRVVGKKIYIYYVDQPSREFPFGSDEEGTTKKNDEHGAARVQYPGDECTRTGAKMGCSP